MIKCQSERACLPAGRRNKGHLERGEGMQEKNLLTPVQYLKGVGPKVSKLLGKLGVRTIQDLIFYFPRDYEDRTHIMPIMSLNTPMDKVLVHGEIVHIENQQARGRFSVIRVTISDKTANIRVIFFNQPYLAQTFQIGMKLIVSGKYEVNDYEGGMQIIPRDWEIDTGEPLTVVPIYNMTEGLYPKGLRKIIKLALDLYLNQIKDVLPKSIISKYKLINIHEAIKNIHYPLDIKQIEPARTRIIFEEFFVFQLGMGVRRKEIKSSKGLPLDVSSEIVSKFPLPFKLTNSQEKVLAEILDDMSKNKPMARLLQGDVGSGKTVIAAISAFVAIQNNYQAAIMAPTEILANQHYDKIKDWFLQYKVKLLTGTTQKKDKKEILEDDLVIGTHALIEEKIKFKKLGLVVIDEQHRFGVLQRSKLAQKGKNPHLLFMTATPIPRSLALTLYGDLDKSVIDEMPPGRKPIKTYYVSKAKRASSYEFIREKIKAGEQVFVVCPLVEESEKIDLKSAIDEAKRLQEYIFPEFRVGLVHGRMKSDDKDFIMRNFKDKKIQILVATTVIEVGIDIPDASIMMIEHAERFGLSALHQLRGRIGRGQNESFCFLMGEPKSQEARARIKAMIDYTDGFKIAEIDLKLRGPGDFCGVRQSGLPEFHLADILRDEKLLGIARDAALDYLSADPDLNNSPDLKEVLYKRYENNFRFS